MPLDWVLLGMIGNSIHNIGCHYFWAGLIALPKNTLPIRVSFQVFCESWHLMKPPQKTYKNVETYAIPKSHSQENSSVTGPTYLPNDFQNSILTTSNFAPLTNVDKVGSWMSSKCNRCIITSSNPHQLCDPTQHPPVVHHPLQICYDYSIVDEP